MVLLHAMGNAATPMRFAQLIQKPNKKPAAHLTKCIGRESVVLSEPRSLILKEMLSAVIQLKD
jgi:hypothetical protein